jgi:hypothetical protein
MIMFLRRIQGIAFPRLWIADLIACMKYHFVSHCAALRGQMKEIDPALLRTEIDLPGGAGGDVCTGDQAAQSIRDHKLCIALRVYDIADACRWIGINTDGTCAALYVMDAHIDRA